MPWDSSACPEHLQYFLLKRESGVQTMWALCLSLHHKVMSSVNIHRDVYILESKKESDPTHLAFMFIGQSGYLSGLQFYIQSWWIDCIRLYTTTTTNIWRKELFHTHIGFKDCVRNRYIKTRISAIQLAMTNQPLPFCDYGHVAWI